MKVMTYNGIEPKLVTSEATKIIELIQAQIDLLKQITATSVMIPAGTQLSVKDLSNEAPGQITSQRFWDACKRVKVTVRNEKGYEETSLYDYWAIGGHSSPLVALARELGLSDEP